MASILKKPKVKLDLLTNINMLLMVEKGLRGGICDTIDWYAKANKNRWNIMMKIKNHHIFSIEM